MQSSINILRAIWSHHDQVVAGVTAFLVFYYAIPPSRRTQIEKLWPRWGSLVGLLRDLFPFLPGVPMRARDILVGAERAVAVTPADARDEEISTLRARVASLAANALTSADMPSAETVAKAAPATIVVVDAEIPVVPPTEVPKE